MNANQCETYPILALLALLAILAMRSSCQAQRSRAFRQSRELLRGCPQTIKRHRASGQAQLVALLASHVVAVETCRKRLTRDLVNKTHGRRQPGKAGTKEAGIEAADRNLAKGHQSGRQLRSGFQSENFAALGLEQRRLHHEFDPQLIMEQAGRIDRRLALIDGAQQAGIVVAVKLQFKSLA